MKKCNDILQKVTRGFRVEDDEALSFAQFDDLKRLLPAATELRDRQFGEVITYSKKIFIPLTNLCRDVCHYCTFAK
ncbi:MAG: hypothetical protein VX986_05730, partial [Pseudomonadota bacterium]|nr:hypothetical protein [Pseudomonadota bacterium]